MRLLKIVVGCVAMCLGTMTGAQEPAFVPGVKTDVLPWTHDRFDSDPLKFTFAIHSDLTGGERPGVFATAMAQLDLLRPEFLISVGDLIEGGLARQKLIAQWDRYDALVRKARFPVMYVGGNHDVATPVERDLWRARYGPIHYHFRYKDVLFLVLDSEDMTPARQQELDVQRQQAFKAYHSQGIEAYRATPYAQRAERLTGSFGPEQADYFVGVLAENADVRHTFLFVHKPVWDAEGGEFTRIEAALKGRAYTAFNGHEHAFAHKLKAGQDHIQLATTGGAFFPQVGRSEDHVTLVTVGGADDVSIAHLMLAGIRDKTGEIPAGGEDLCFSPEACRNR